MNAIAKAISDTSAPLTDTHRAAFRRIAARLDAGDDPGAVAAAALLQWQRAQEDMHRLELDARWFAALNNSRNGG